MLDGVQTRMKLVGGKRIIMLRQHGVTSHVQAVIRNPGDALNTILGTVVIPIIAHNKAAINDRTDREYVPCAVCQREKIEAKIKRH